MATPRYRPSPSHASRRQENVDWDLSKIIDVDPETPGFTCVGWARTQGRRCHNPIAIGNRNAARSLLALGSQKLQSRQAVKDTLSDLGPLVLCRRWHQDQAVEMTAIWVRSVTQFEESLKEDFENDEFEEVDSEQGSPVGDSEEEPSEDGGDEPETELRRTITRKKAKGEDCFICYEGLLDKKARFPKPLVWCRVQCGTNFHKGCMDGWTSTCERQSRPATCPYWYVMHVAP